MYSEKAIERCRALYCRFGGRNLDAIEREMRKEYSGWKKQYLFDHGKEGSKHFRFGWVTKFGFDRSLEIYTEKLVAQVNDDEQDLYIGIRNTRKNLQKKIGGTDATKDELYQYRDFCKLEIEARRNLDLSRDNLETFVAGYEKQINWLSEIDPAAAKLLIKNGDKLIEMAQAHYGKAETDDDGASDREDEGRE